MARRTTDLQMPDLSRGHVQLDKLSCRWIQARKVHEAEVASVFFVASDSFVVVEKIAAAV